MILKFRIWHIPLQIFLFAGLFFGMHQWQETRQYEKGALYFSGDVIGYIFLFALASVALLFSLYWNRRARMFWLIVGIPVLLFAGFKYYQNFDYGTRVDHQKITVNDQVYTWSDIKSATVDWTGKASARNLYFEYTLTFKDGSSIDLLSEEFDATKINIIHEKVLQSKIPVVIRTPLNEKVIKRIERSYSKEEVALLKRLFTVDK